MTILYLYAELMGYQIPVLKEYVKKYHADVHVVHWDHKKLTPYVPPVVPGVSYYNRSEFNLERLMELSQIIKPEIVYVSGWMDKDYLAICKALRIKNIPVVVGSDTQWRGGLKQRLGLIYFQVFLKKCFSHIWVAGPFQYEYARKLGFKKNTIIFNCLTADVSLFNVTKPIPLSYPHKFLFLGRFEKVKGIEVLIEAWKSLKVKKDWTLTFIGNGSDEENLKMNPEIIVKDFLHPDELKNEINKYGFLILPSLKEPWALVIHEAMAAGIPVLATENCGASPVFIIPGYNGFKIVKNRVDYLINALEIIISSSDDELKTFAINAKKRSDVINPEIVAASFISVLY